MAQGELIYCPRCEKKGKKEVLGAMYKGAFRVLRFHRGETVIQSEEFEIYCGQCGEKVFYRNKLTEGYENTENSPNNRDERVFRQAPVGSAIQSGI